MRMLRTPPSKTKLDKQTNQQTTKKIGGHNDGRTFGRARAPPERAYAKKINGLHRFILKLEKDYCEDKFLSQYRLAKEHLVRGL